MPHTSAMVVRAPFRRTPSSTPTVTLHTITMTKLDTSMVSRETLCFRVPTTNFDVITRQLDTPNPTAITQNSKQGILPSTIPASRRHIAHCIARQLRNRKHYRDPSCASCRLSRGLQGLCHVVHVRSHLEHTLSVSPGM